MTLVVASKVMSRLIVTSVSSGMRCALRLADGGVDGDRRCIPADGDDGADVTTCKSVLRTRTGPMLSISTELSLNSNASSTKPVVPALMVRLFVFIVLMNLTRVSGTNSVETNRRCCTVGCVGLISIGCGGCSWGSSLFGGDVSRVGVTSDTAVGGSSCVCGGLGVIGDAWISDGGEGLACSTWDNSSWVLACCC